MIHGDGGKLDKRRPGDGYEEGHERIWPSKKKAPEVPAEEDEEKTDDR